MEAKSFDENSWHFRLATVYGPEYRWNLINNGSDICSYTRAVLSGILLVIAIVAMGTFVGFSLMSTVLVAVVYLLTGQLAYDEWAVGFIIGGVILSILFAGIPLVGYMYEQYHRWPSEKRRSSKLSFITEAYNSWKQKMCYKISFSQPEQ